VIEMTITLSHVRRRRCGPPQGSRPGFSLTELLVVIAILGILSSLMLAGLNGARARVRADKASITIRKINEVLLPYYEEYEVRRPNLPALTRRSVGAKEELRRVALRRLITLELPESPADLAFAPFTITAPAALVQNPPLTLNEVPPASRRYAQIISLASAPDVDSAELLYMIVMRGPMADGDVLSHFRPDEVGDIDEDGLPEFLDAWRRPIRYRRWPVGIESPLQPTTGDPDPLLSLRGYRLMPLIYSAGQNGDYDLEIALGPPSRGSTSNNYEPFAASDPAPQVLAAVGKDDVTNHDLGR
jgi:prepilin-type N-terminal cleavage/methylation domain-containing protein